MDTADTNSAHLSLVTPGLHHSDHPTTQILLPHLGKPLRIHQDHLHALINDHAMFELLINK